VGEDIDFEAAEKKAREEAERIERLGYDPEAEKAEEAYKTKSTVTEKTNIAAPTPISPPRAGLASQQSHQRSPSEIERLGMGMGRLGFGQIGSTKPTTAPAPRKLGFGAVGATKAADGRSPLMVSIILAKWTGLDDAEKYARDKFGSQKGISSDEFFGRNNFDPSAQAEAKTRLQGFEGATSISSNAYFGRPEDDLQGEENYGDLETAAKDFVRRFGLTAGDDLENLSQVLGEGATRLQGAIRNYLNNWGRGTRAKSEGLVFNGFHVEAAFGVWDFRHDVPDADCVARLRWRIPAQIPKARNNPLLRYEDFNINVPPAPVNLSV
jgi:ADP-ribosylation factor GTPase-activating protein 2/3